MSDYSAKIAQARSAGYSDAQIAEYLGSDPEMGTKVKTAKDAGYSDADILAHLESTPAPKPAPSEIPAPRNPVVDYLDRHGRELATLGGGVVGGLIAAPAAVAASVPTAGLGGIATEAAATGLGAGIGGQVYDIAKNALAPKMPAPTFGSQTKAVLQDVGTNALGAVGGQVVGKGLGLLAEKTAPIIAKTSDELKALAQTAYKKAEDAGVVFSPSAYKGFVDDVQKTLHDKGFDVDLHPNTSSAVKRLVSDIQKPIKSFKDLATLRLVINNAASKPSSDAGEMRLINTVKNKLDDFVANNKNVVSGNHEIAIPAINEARKLWSQMSKSDTIEDLIKRASLSKSDPATALQGEFKTLAKSKTRMRGFSDEERKAIEDFSKGKGGVDVLKFIGSFAPGANLPGTIKLAAYGAGAAGGGVAPAIAGAATTLAAKAAANKLAAANAARIAALMRGGQRAAVPSSNAMARFATRGVANLNSPSNALAQ
jgi:hypothetical protein